jgi:hypothetical protein
VQPAIAAMAIIYLGVVVSFLLTPVLRDMDAAGADG